MRIAGKFGKLPARHDPRSLMLAHYASNAPLPPATYSSLDRVYANLKVSDPAMLFPMDGNDQYGDCTWAGMAHAVTVFQGLIGKQSIMAAQDVVNGYFAFTNGQDSGCNELDVLNYWQKNAVGGDKILAYTQVHPTDHVNVERAINWFGGVYIGMSVTQDCQQQFSDGQPWTPGPMTQNEGHCVVAVEYDANGITVLTWGNVQKATWAWWDECVDEVHAILPPEAATAGYAPGLNLQQLQADLKEVTA